MSGIHVEKLWHRLIVRRSYSSPSHHSFFESSLLSSGSYNRRGETTNSNVGVSADSAGSSAVSVGYASVSPVVPVLLAQRVAHATGSVVT